MLLWFNQPKYNTVPCFCLIYCSFWQNWYLAFIILWPNKYHLLGVKWFTIFTFTFAQFYNVFIFPRINYLSVICSFLYVPIDNSSHCPRVSNSLSIQYSKLKTLPILCSLYARFSPSLWAFCFLAQIWANYARKDAPVPLSLILVNLLTIFLCQMLCFQNLKFSFSKV